jgi:creatinine amidohydrolase
VATDLLLFILMIEIVASAESAARGRALLTTRVSKAGDFVARIPHRLEALEREPKKLPRTLVTTGIGTSEGHARHLAEAALRWADQPARFASTGSLAQGAPPGSEEDWLVVFSQGLSPNARHAFRGLERWGGIVLVTGLASTSTRESRSVEDQAGVAERREWLEELESRGVVHIDMGCGAERGALIRVIGARVGYSIGWSLLRTLARRRLIPAPGLEMDPQRLREAQANAHLEASHVFPETVAISPFFDAARSLIIVSQGGAQELTDHLALKLAEGMLRPQPRCVDVLQFAHGPLQSLAERPTSILYLSQAEPDPSEADWLRRFADTLDPELHDLRVLRARLPFPFAAVEYEAIFDAFLLRALGENATDLVDWPGAEREASLYSAGPVHEEGDAPKQGKATASIGRFEDATWPDVEGWIKRGRRTALIALGSIEQHGHHLPLGTDRFIADALVRGLADRLDDAVALPALAIGCAREHLDFSGTLHIEPETLEAILRDLLGSLAQHGFERAFVFTAHGGNVDALDEMETRLAESAAGIALRIETDIRVGAMQSEVVATEALDPESAGPHAGEYETSIIAKLRPGTIRREELRPGRIVGAGEAQALFYPSLRPNTESGVLGDPSMASATRGERYLTAWLDLLEGAYRAAFSGRTEKNRQ